MLKKLKLIQQRKKVEKLLNLQCKIYFLVKDAYYLQQTKFEKHILKIYKSVTSPEAKILALLHDIFKDTNLTIKDLKRIGVPKHLIKKVKLLTLKKGESDYHYIQKIIKDPIAKEVKKADLLYNCDLNNYGKNNLTQTDFNKIQESKYFLQYFK